jgi:hypothetical protein
MSRKKRSPSSCPVEAVIWWDAAMATREILDIDKTVLHTVGFVVHEDDAHVILAHEVESEIHWLSEEMDYTRIPKPLIMKRTVLGTIDMDDRGESAKEPVKEIVNGSDTPA